jgi:DNA-binding transcriptional MerR regulator
MEQNVYSPKKFGQLIGKAVVTLQRWDRKGILVAKRSPTNRRYYTHQQYLDYLRAGDRESKDPVSPTSERE